MAVLYTLESAPVAAFFHKTPPRTITKCTSAEMAIAALQGGLCKYALVPVASGIQRNLEICATRPGWVLLQRSGQLTRSDKRSQKRSSRINPGDNNRKPVLW